MAPPWPRPEPCYFSFHRLNHIVRAENVLDDSVFALSAATLAASPKAHISENTCSQLGDRTVTISASRACTMLRTKVASTPTSQGDTEHLLPGGANADETGVRAHGPLHLYAPPAKHN